MNIDAFPLQWPATKPRVDRPQRSKFRTSFGAARDSVMLELRRMGVSLQTVTMSSNVPLRMDGLPRATRYTIDDPGVAVYFERSGRPLCIACDKWDRVEDNMHAIAKSIDALRGLERWGSKHMVDAAFQGFEALPAKSQHGWWVVLDVERDASSHDVKRAWIAKAMAAHPDKGGDPEEFHHVQDAYEEFKRERGQ